MIRFLFLSFIVLLVACKDDAPPKKKNLSKEQVKQLSEQMNVWDEKRQNDEIEQYLKAHGWTMERTPSGLRYMMISPGKGPQAKLGQTASVNYKIYLLDGTVCYTSDQGPKDVLIGKDNVEAGVHEALQLMHVGDKMRFILPSHLAHGLAGDQSKIPPLASVVYEIELVSVK